MQEGPGYYSALLHYLTITGMFGLVLYLAKRWLSRGAAQRGRGAVGRVVGVVSLTPSSRLFVVAIGSVYYLVPEGQAGEPVPLAPEQIDGLRLVQEESFGEIMAQRRRSGVVEDQVRRLLQTGQQPR